MHAPALKKFIATLSLTLLAACGGGANTVIPASGGSGLPPAAASLGPLNTPLTVADVEWRLEGARVEVRDADDDGRGALPGMVLRLEGAMDAGNRSARVSQASLQAELRGPVSSVDLPAQRFTALGQTVQLDTRTVLDGLGSLAELTPGQAVQVHGLIGPNGTLLATRLQRRSSNAVLKLSGQVSYDQCPVCAPAIGTFLIGSQVVSAGSAQLRGLSLPIAAGTSVRVRAAQAPEQGALVASEVSAYVEPALLADAITRVRGLLTEPQPGRFQLQGVTLAMDGVIAYESGSAADLRAGRELSVEGRYRAGVLQVTALRFER